MKKYGYKYLKGDKKEDLISSSKNLRNKVKSAEIKGNIYKPLAYAEWEGAKTYIPTNFIEYPGIKMESFYFEMEPGVKGVKHIHPISDEIYLVLDGTGNLYLEDKVFDLAIGDIFHILAGQWHYIDTINSKDKIKVFIVISPPLPFFLREEGYNSVIAENIKAK